MSNNEVPKKRLTTEEIVEALGANESFPVSELPERRPELAKALSSVATFLPQLGEGLQASDPDFEGDEGHPSEIDK